MPCIAERLLAPRLLHFTYDQVFWECATTCACEALPNGLPTRLDAAARYDREWRGRLQRLGSGSSANDGGLHGGEFEFWKRAVHFFTSCRITKYSDKLKAIQGVPDLMGNAQRQYAGQWFAHQGLWVQNLVCELSWKMPDGQTASRPTKDIQLDGKNLTEQQRELSFPS